MSGLRAVANFGVGLDHLDLQKFTDLGVKVANTPAVLNTAVAELTLALMMASARNLIQGEEGVRSHTTMWCGVVVCGCVCVWGVYGVCV